MFRRAGRTGPVAIGVTVAALICLAEGARAAKPCGEIGSAAAESDGGLMYEVEGAVRVRAVQCERAKRIAFAYIDRTSAEGGRLKVKGFRCRGGPRRGDRFIIDCRRPEQAKRIYLEGTGGPGGRSGGR
jgi:hypothetical protein